MSTSKANRRPRICALLGALALLALGAGFAHGAEITQKGNVRVAIEGKLAPSTLPRSGAAPVAVSVAGKITTADESSPPQLHKLTIEINRHGRIDAHGLPTCRLSRIRTASNGHALAACRSSLVGEGKFFGTITLPGSAPYPIEGKLLLFNGTEGGHQVIYGHIFSPHPFATSFVITFAVSAQRRGEYGTTLTANLTKALGTQRNLTGLEMTLKRSFSFKGRRHSYISAGCPAPKGVPILSFPLARTSFAFAGNIQITETLNKTCKPRG